MAFCPKTLVVILEPHACHTIFSILHPLVFLRALHRRLVWLLVDGKDDWFVR